MTVKWLCSLLLFGLFLARVFSTQNQVSDDPVCPSPYSCIPTSECAERHSARGIEEVLFQCEGKKKVCCPGLKPLPSAASSQDINEYQTTECTKVKDWTLNPQQHNRQQTADKEHLRETTPHGNRHQVQQPAESKQPQALESRRPSEFQQPQRPQNLQPTQRPQNLQPTQRPQNLQPTQRPQNLQPTQRPQNLQPTQRPQNFHSQRPVGLQSLLPTQKPQNSKPLSTHKNFRLLPTESNCGVNNFANRITEGEEVSLGEYPWMVLTGLKDKYGNYRWNCGGTLINGWYVLTAAHCLIVDNRTIEFVRLGEHSLTNTTDCSREICLESPEDVAIAEVIPHERWNTTTIKNDIALLRLSRNPLKLGKSNIYPICLPVNVDKLNITSSTKYEVAGWGKTDWNADEGSDVLRKASISGVNREECNICNGKKKQQYCPIVDTQLCVQGWKSVDVCKGDSGGPLMVTRLNIYQIGITSFKGSEYCGAENIPSIFTKVESYLPWILDNIRE